MSKNHLRNTLGGGGNSNPAQKQIVKNTAKALIAFGLASLLPSFACADESVENLKKVLENQDRDSQKVKKLDDDSPVVGLRDSALGRNSAEWDKIFANDPVVIDKDTTIGSLDNDIASGDSSRWNVTTNDAPTKASKNITINNDAKLTIYAHNYGMYGSRFAAAGSFESLTTQTLLWRGGTIDINFRMGTGGYDVSNHDRGAILALGEASFTIESNLIFNYIDENNKVGNDKEYYGSAFVSAVGANGGGVFKLLGNQIKIEINQFKDEAGNSTDNRNYGLGGFALYASESEFFDKKGGSIYLNAKDDETIKDANATVQITGGISTSSKDSGWVTNGGGKIYAHFTGADSFLKGNVYAGRYDNDSKPLTTLSTLKMSFTDGATMTGGIVFSGDAKGSTSDILFANGSSLNGKILDLGVGAHKVTFDGATFTGSVKRDGSVEELKTIGVVAVSRPHDIEVSKAGTSNTVITLKNQAQWTMKEASSVHQLNILGDATKTNTLTISDSVTGKNEITTLNLGETGTTTGSLTIANNSTNALTIANFASAGTNNILAISAGEVVIENALTGTNNNFTLNGATLTLNNKANGTSGTSSTIAKLDTTGTNTINLNAGETIINAISGNETNNFTLNSSAGLTALTLNGATNQIATFTALSGNATSTNTLTIGANATATISRLVLGDDTVGKIKEGLLTISNASSSVLTITNFESKHTSSKLTISAGAIEIKNLTGANNNIVLIDNTSLTLNGGTLNKLETTGVATINLASGNTIITSVKTDGTNHFKLTGTSEERTSAVFKSTFGGNGANNFTLNSADLIFETKNEITNLTLTRGTNNTISLGGNLAITKLSETAGSTKDTKLTFVNEITRDVAADRYTASHLMIGGSSEANGRLNGTYQMAIGGDEAIDPTEITYQEDSNNNVKVATIKKHSGAISGNTQEELRSQGVIDLGVETTTELTGTLELKSFKYHVAETDGSGDSQANGDYITYFLNGEGKTIIDIKESILSNIAFSVTGLYLANFNSLNKRLGELRDNNRSNGVWARVFNGQQSNSIGLKNSTNFTTVQAGYDYAFGLNGANNYLGFAISYSHSQSKFKDKASFVSDLANAFASIDSFKSDAVEVALYNAYVADSGWYNDTVAKFSYLLNQVAFTRGGVNQRSFSDQGDINTYAFTLSNEIGYRFKLGASDEWYIDPQAEIGFGYFEGKEFDFSRAKLLGTMDSLLTLRGRVGASFGYDFKNFTNRENGLSAKLHLGVFGEFDYFNGGDVKFKGGIAERAVNTDMRAVLNVGTNLEIKESTRLYFDIESSFWGKITTDYKVNAGVRYAFGENTSYKPSGAVQKDINAEKAPLKIDNKEEAKQEVKPAVEQEAQKQEQAPKNTKAEKKPAKKQPAKKQVTKKQPVKKQAQAKKPAVKKAEANKAKGANRTAQTEGRKGNDWGWW